MLCQMAGLSLFVCGRIIFILYVYCIALSIDEYLDCFHVLTVVNNAAVKQQSAGVQISLPVRIFISFR